MAWVHRLGMPSRKQRIELELPLSVAPKTALLQELIRVLNRSGMFLEPDPPTPLGEQILDACFKHGGHGFHNSLQHMPLLWGCQQQMTFILPRIKAPC